MMWNSFKYFPRTAKNIEFSNRPSAISKPMETRTNDGLGLTLHVSFQYQLLKDEIPELYKLANMKYEETFIRIARDTIIKEAGKFESTSYWVRKLINVRLTDLQLVTNSLRR